MSQIPNFYIPFPRYENAVFIGDTAIETLSSMKIYAKGLIGSDIPNMHTYHPYEKHLECTACVLNDRRILTKALEKQSMDYVLLEDNGRSELNPVVLKAGLQEIGIKTLILDVTGCPQEVLQRAGELFGEQARARRAIKLFDEKYRLINDRLCTPIRKALILLSVRHPFTDELYHFALSAQSELSQFIVPLNVKNVLTDDRPSSPMQGVIDFDDISSQTLTNLNPDFIALCGDASGGMLALNQRIHREGFYCQAIRNMNIFSLPYYCDAMKCQQPWIMQKWVECLDPKN